MRKLLILCVSFMLFACASKVGINDIAGQMPADNRSVMVQISSTSNPLSDAMLVGMIKTSGGNAANQLMEVLAIDDINIGLFGATQMVNKATAIYSLEHAPKIGKKVSLYMIGDSQGDKSDLEQAAQSKGVSMHYIMRK